MKVDGEDLCQWRKREYWSDIVGETIDVGGSVANGTDMVGRFAVESVDDDSVDDDSVDDNSVDDDSECMSEE